MEHEPKHNVVESYQLFRGKVIYLIRKGGIGSKYFNILKKNVESKGGIVVEKYQSNVTHVVATSYDVASKNIAPTVKIPFVATSWITESICANSLADAKVHELLAVDFSGISLKASQELAKEAAEASSTKKRKKDQSSDKVSPKQDEAQLDPVVAHNLKQVPKCYHKKPASLRKVTGSNFGKFYFTCCEEFPQKRCNFYQWAHSLQASSSDSEEDEVVKKRKRTSLEYKVVKRDGDATPTAPLIRSLSRSAETPSSWLCYGDSDSGKEEKSKDDSSLFSTSKKFSFTDMIKVPDSWASYPTNSIELSLDMDEAPSETPKVNSTPQSTELSKSSSSGELDLNNFRDSSYSSDEDTKTNTVTLEKTVQEIIKLNQNSRWRKSFACQKTPEDKLTSENSNLNKHITDALEILQSKSESTGDKWRSYAYRKAIVALKTYPKKITSLEEAKEIRGIGSRISHKIGEILETGKLRQAEFAKKDTNIETMALFSKIWGAGSKSINKWIALGYKTLDDLKSKANLTSQQKIGIQYYDEFQKRIPREEVAKIESTVKSHLKRIDKNLKAVTCGSYRRGKDDCGDIDILITHKNGHVSHDFLPTLVQTLHEFHLLTDDLTTSWDDSYMGVCCLAEVGIHRRIDIRYYPLTEFPCALLYFTGSGHFNRSMRLWARKHGYSLSDHSLVKRWAEDMKGEPIPVKSEEDIFRVLELEYKTPEQRDM